MNPGYPTLRTLLYPKSFILNFAQFYNNRTRIYCHLAFWMVLSGFYLANMLLINTQFPFRLSFAIVIRQIVQSMFFFYFTAYFVIPRLFFNNRILAGVVCLTIPFIMAPIIDVLVFRTFNTTLLRDRGDEANISAGLFSTNFSQALNRENIMLTIMPMLLRTLPAFMLKILTAAIHIFSEDDKQRRKKERLEIENIELEMNFLKLQLNPHYLFNTLNNIYSYAYLQDGRTPGMISDLTEILKYTLYESKNTLAPLDGEIRFLRNYLSMERMRYEDVNARIEFHQKGAFGPDAMIAPLILFPFVENAVKYGIKENKNAGWVVVRLESAEDGLTFSVENNKSSAGKNNHETQENRIGGIGVSTTKRRLEMLYPEHQLTIENSGHTYAVLLKIKRLDHEPKTEMHHR